MTEWFLWGTHLWYRSNGAKFILRRVDGYILGILWIGWGHLKGFEILICEILTRKVHIESEEGFNGFLEECAFLKRS